MKSRLVGTRNQTDRLDVEAPSPDDPVGLAPAEQARAAVHVGLWVSATRCVLTYLVAPALGVFGILLGPLGLLLQLLGAVTASCGAIRLWQAGHRIRWPYLAVALAVDLTALSAVLELLRGLR